MLICMRTTLHLNESLIKRAKAFALKNHRTLTSVLEESLRRLLDQQKEMPLQKIMDLCTVKGPVNPGIDLNDSASLLDIMENQK